jgi:hypothetical protein
MLSAVAAHEGWEVHHMDAKSAFLNGELQEEVYVAQPVGFVVKGVEHKVLKLKKALYGLRQALRVWNVKLDSCLLSLRFQKSKAEHGVYVRGTGEAKLVVGVYVDDLIITGHSGINKFKTEMKKEFRMSDLGYFLIIWVLRFRSQRRGSELDSLLLQPSLWREVACQIAMFVQSPWNQD